MRGWGGGGGGRRGFNKDGPPVSQPLFLSCTNLYRNGTTHPTAQLCVVISTKNSCQRKSLPYISQHDEPS